MRLYIAEKPSVAGDIVKAIGKRFDRKDGYYESEGEIVTWCYGHLIQSAEPETYNPTYKHWNMNDLPLKLYPLKYEIIKGKELHTKQVISLIKKADEIVHAGDPDDEGQLLVDALLQYAENSKPVKRLLINDNTDLAIKKALTNLKDNKDFQGIKNKALARSVGDLIYGLSMTRGYTIAGRRAGYQGTLSVGRVQTPILGLIVRRWQAFNAHTSTFYYSIVGNFEINGQNFFANWKINEEAPKDDKKRLSSKLYASELATKLISKNAIIKEASVKDKETAPPLPFNLVKLQQQMHKKHKLSAARTLEITQALREKHKAITYNRSDCSYLTEEQFAQSTQVITGLKSIFNLTNVAIDTTQKSKAFDDTKVTAHTAIIPTSKAPNLSSLSADEKLVYEAIANQYIVQFLSNKKYQEVSVVVEVEGEIFSANARKTIDLGFTGFLKGEEADEEEDLEGDEVSSPFEILQTMKVGGNGACCEIMVNEKKTTPPPLFTEGTLLAALVRVADFVEDANIKDLLKRKDKDKKDEHGGIGTPATRSDILEKLKTRQFIKEEKGKLIPTQTGIEFFSVLPIAATLPDLTALWAAKQESIENGELTVDSFVLELITKLEEEVKNISVKGISQTPEGNNKVTQNNNRQMREKLKYPCPNCGGEVLIYPKVFACRSCEFKIWATKSEKTLTKTMVENLINKGLTQELKGFKNKESKEFSAKLVLKDKVTGKVGFEFLSEKS